MLNICTIGIGNAGNQIAELAYKTKSIPGLAMNSSQKDLSTVKSIPKLVVGDEKGAGKNRDDAKDFIKKRIKDFLDAENFVNHIAPADVIFIISSIAGGTGSGMAPIMTDILSRKFSDKTFVLVEVYPPLRESVAAQQNALDFLKEIQDRQPNAVYMAYDNNRKAHKPTSVMMQEVNEEIVEHLAIIRGDYQFATPYNSIDEKDMLKILSTNGRLAIYDIHDIKEKDLDNKTFEDLIIDRIKNTSTNVELDRNKIVKRLGLITNLTESMNGTFDTNLRAIKDLIGEPVEGFEHTSVIADDEINRVIVILSGLTIPDDRLTLMTQRIEEGLAELDKTVKNSVLESFSTDSVKTLRNGDIKGSDELDLDEIFNNY